MRQSLVNENPDLAADSRYVMRITGDNDEGKAELENFTFPESKYPVIATTSKLMTTGVDAQTCKLIVLDQRIQSMTEFKQIIGRGTRINEDYGKFYFTIIDFKKATELFADPDFDGDPVQIYEPKADESPVPPDLPEDEFIYQDEDIEKGATSFRDIESNSSYNFTEPIADPSFRRYVVANVEVKVAAERVQYFDANGKLITESLKDYTRKAIAKDFESLDDFLKCWSSADKKQAIVDELAQEGIFFEALADEIGRDCDPFDLLCHIVWDRQPLTRKERAERVKKRNYFTEYGEQAKRVLDALLDKYADEGVAQIEENQVLTIAPFSQIGTPMEIVRAFGGLDGYQRAVRELKRSLYSA
jgi:type I restriction enzyme R subunit